MEPRLVLSLIFSPEDAQAGAAGLAGAEAHGNGPPISLDIVALHELGHSLGLDHSNNPNSIMYPYYNANYDLNNFYNDPAVAELQELYANVETSPWKDSLDPTPGDGKVEITYSFMPDGIKLDRGQNTLFSTFDAIFTNAWEQIFSDELSRWANVSNGKIAFDERSDDGMPFNYSGSAQNNPHSGDIRIGAHPFDGPSKVLAHTFLTPSDGATATADGDVHFDNAENWVGLSGMTLGAAPTVAMVPAPALSASNRLAAVASPTDAAPGVIIPMLPQSFADGRPFGHRSFERFG